MSCMRYGVALSRIYAPTGFTIGVSPAIVGPTWRFLSISKTLSPVGEPSCILSWTHHLTRCPIPPRLGVPGSWFFGHTDIVLDPSEMPCENGLRAFKNPILLGQTMFHWDWMDSRVKIGEGFWVGRLCPSNLLGCIPIAIQLFQSLRLLHLDKLNTCV